MKALFISLKGPLLLLSVLSSNKPFNHNTSIIIKDAGILTLDNIFFIIATK